jgi:hypothetical protein
MSECRFVLESLGRGGISEAASLGEQSWRLSAGGLGTARPTWVWVVWFGSADQGRSALPVDGFEYSAQAF